MGAFFGYGDRTLHIGSLLLRLAALCFALWLSGTLLFALWCTWPAAQWGSEQLDRFLQLNFWSPKNITSASSENLTFTGLRGQLDSFVDVADSSVLPCDPVQCAAHHASLATITPAPSPVAVAAMTSEPPLDAGCASAREQNMKKAVEEWSVGTFDCGDPDSICNWIHLFDSTSLRGGTGGTVHILFYGDSVDRYLIDDGCNSALLYNGTKHDWADTVIKYKTGASASAICETEWGSFSFVHLYGAAPTGPYLHGQANTDDDPYTDTTARIRKTYELYKDRFDREPDLVVYQSNIWDSVHHARGDPRIIGTKDDFAKKYYSDIGNNIDLLKSMVSSHVTLMLRTTPNTEYRPIQTQFNAAIRLVGQRKCIGVLDWEAMVSYIRLKHKAPDSIFRDRSHLNPVHSASFLKAVKELAENRIINAPPSD